MLSTPPYSFSESNGPLWGVTEYVGGGPSGVASQSSRRTSFRSESERIIDVSVASAQRGEQRSRVVIPFPNSPREMWPGNSSGILILYIDNLVNELRDPKNRLRSAGSVQK